MTIRTRSGLAVIALSLAFFAVSGGAIAGERGGVRIDGNVTTTTIVLGNATTAARGIGTEAITSIGSISKGTRRNGNVNVTTVVKSVSNIASGFGTSSCVSVGTIGKNPCK